MIARNSQEDRRRERARVGTLKSLIVSQKTEKLYGIRFNEFAQTISMMGWVVSTLGDLDTYLCWHIEDLWHEGLPRGHANYCYAAVKFFVPSVSSLLYGADKLLKAWSKMELPARAVPFTPDICAGMAGVALLQGWWPDALLYLVMFHALLRTAEGPNLLVKDITLGPCGLKAVIRLESTKTSVMSKDSLRTQTRRKCNQ